MNNCRIGDLTIGISFDPMKYFTKEIGWTFDSTPAPYVDPFSIYNPKRSIDSKGITIIYTISGIGRKHVEAAYYNNTILIKYKNGDNQGSIKECLNTLTSAKKMYDLSKAEIIMRYGILTLFVPFAPEIDKMKNKIPIN